MGIDPFINHRTESTEHKLIKMKKVEREIFLSLFRNLLTCSYLGFYFLGSVSENLP